ncbi:MAG TPA: GGDEF domain-containing protein [Baekduia sp.]|nr:GGDEF domain-containing protein [Baekduia sp.]
METASDQVVRWRSLAVLFLAGGLLVLSSLVVPARPAGDDLVVAMVATTAVVTAGVLWWLAARLPGPAMSPVLGFGTVLITLVTIASHQPDGRYSLLYVWVALQAFCFLRPRWGLCHIGGVAIGYGIALRALGGGIDQWLMVVGTATVAGWLAGTLTARIEHLHAHASVDPLTGVGNRRAFDLSLDRALRLARADTSRVSLLIADLDHFKSINDRHGHVAGDAALKDFAALAQQAAAGAHVGRLGGDEFALVLPGVDHEQAQLVALGLAEATRRDHGLRAAGITASIGVAAFPTHGESAKALLRAADEALYRAKALGRDRAESIARVAP